MLNNKILCLKNSKKFYVLKHGSASVLEGKDKSFLKQEKVPVKVSIGHDRTSPFNHTINLR